MLEHRVITQQRARGAGVRRRERCKPPRSCTPPPTPRAATRALYAHREMLFANAALEALGADTEPRSSACSRSSSHFLVLHEIGHTLGLNHNFRSSHLHSLDDDLRSRQDLSASASHGSVMDYPTMPFALPGKTQGQFWTTRPGPYDHWAIDVRLFAGARGSKPPKRARLETMLARSTDPQLAFGNDADDMRAPGKAIDPRAMIDDMTSDPIGFARARDGRRARGRRAAVRGAVDATTGESYQAAAQRLFVTAATATASAARVASRFIGGVYVDRAMVNQAGRRRSADAREPRGSGRAMRAAPRARVRARRVRARSRVRPSALLAQRRGFDHFALYGGPEVSRAGARHAEGHPRSPAASRACCSGSPTRACTATSTRSASMLPT